MRIIPAIFVGMIVILWPLRGYGVEKKVFQITDQNNLSEEQEIIENLDVLENMDMLEEDIDFLGHLEDKESGDEQ